MQSALSLELLDGACGGLRLDQMRMSTNVEDRRGEQQWTPTEDGRLVGPNGEWTWDGSINQNQPEVQYTPTEDGYIHGSDGSFRPDESINATIRADENERALQANPDYQDLQHYVDDSLNNRLTPTEDGHMVGSNGRVYDDPTINQNQPAPEYNPQPGEYVGEGDPYPEENNNTEEAPSDGGGDPGGGGTEE